MSDPDDPRPYRPVAVWFFLIIMAVTGLVLLAHWLQGQYGT